MSLAEIEACEIRILDGDEALGHAEALGAVLADCVAGGASVNFMAPYSVKDATAFFKGVAAEAAGGRTILIAGFVEGVLLGTVQVRLAMPPNQPHRAEIAKMLVHRSARRRGLAARLLAVAEAAAARAGKSLLCLDTAVGGEAEHLYRARAWVECGLIPDFALWPDGRYCATRLFYKRIEPLR
jgi:GNAT superfamily N-acetyltransferase